jgi:hypothetical protein
MYALSVETPSRVPRDAWREFPKRKPHSAKKKLHETAIACATFILPWPRLL